MLNPIEKMSTHEFLTAVRACNFGDLYREDKDTDDEGMTKLFVYRLLASLYLHDMESMGAYYQINDPEFYEVCINSYRDLDDEFYDSVMTIRNYLSQAIACTEHFKICINQGQDPEEYIQLALIRHGQSMEREQNLIKFLEIYDNLTPDQMGGPHKYDIELASAREAWSLGRAAFFGSYRGFDNKGYYLPIDPAMGLNYASWIRGIHEAFGAVRNALAYHKGATVFKH